MSHEALPIDIPAFARALEDLPVDALHTKAEELLNSIEHLKYSNNEMMPFADEGDQDCKDAMFENLIVIGRMNERINLLRAEVEKRGMRWAYAEVEDQAAIPNTTETNQPLVNGATTIDSIAAASNTSEEQTPRTGSGRLTDEELMARLQERMHESGDDDDGVHL